MQWPRIALALLVTVSFNAIFCVSVLHRCISTSFRDGPFRFRFAAQELYYGIESLAATAEGGPHSGDCVGSDTLSSYPAAMRCPALA
eukprot:522579-Rhodomonas_salina.3